MTQNVLDRSRQRRKLLTPSIARTLRERAALTQAEIAEAIGVDPATVSRWESGRRHPGRANADLYTALLSQLAREVLG